MPKHKVEFDCFTQNN